MSDGLLWSRKAGAFAAHPPSLKEQSASSRSPSSSPLRMRLAKILVIPSLWASFVQARPSPQAPSQQKTPTADGSNQPQSIGLFSPDSLYRLVAGGVLVILGGMGGSIYILNGKIGELRKDVNGVTDKTNNAVRQFEELNSKHETRRQADIGRHKKLATDTNRRLTSLENSISQRLKPVDMHQFLLDWTAAEECIYTKLGLFEKVWSYPTAFSPTKTSPFPHDSGELLWRIIPQKRLH